MGDEQLTNRSNKGIKSAQARSVRSNKSLLKKSAQVS